MTYYISPPVADDIADQARRQGVALFRVIAPTSHGPYGVLCHYQDYDPRVALRRALAMAESYGRGALVERVDAELCAVVGGAITPEIAA